MNRYTVPETGDYKCQDGSVRTLEKGWFIHEDVKAVIVYDGEIVQHIFRNDCYGFSLIVRTPFEGAPTISVGFAWPPVEMSGELKLPDTITYYTSRGFDWPQATVGTHAEPEQDKDVMAKLRADNEKLREEIAALKRQLEPAPPEPENPLHRALAIGIDRRGLRCDQV